MKIFLVLLLLIQISCTSFVAPQKAHNNTIRFQHTSSIPQPPPDDESVGKVITTVKKGQAVPFSGTLMSPAAVAEIIAKIEQIDLQIKNEVEKAKAEQKAVDDFKIRNLEIEKERLEKEKQLMVQTRDDQIKFLEEQLKKANNPNNEIWLGLGVLGGIVIMISSAAIINLVNEN